MANILLPSYSRSKPRANVMIRKTKGFLVAKNAEQVAISGGPKRVNPSESIWRLDLVDGYGTPKAQPPDFLEFVISPAYLGHKRGLFPRQESFLRRGMSFDPNQVFSREKSVTTLVAMWGKGSGKDFLSSLVLAWLAYVLNSLADPWGYLDHAQGDQFDIVNIATNASQASTVFFNKLKSRIGSACFNQFAPRICENTIIFERSLPGKSRPDVLLQMHSLHAENESWEGKSVLAWVMDEADAFEDRKGNNMADLCFGTLESSATSRFKTRWLGFIISFRRVQDGFMDQRRADAQRDPAMIFDQGTTFELRPDVTREEAAIKRHYKRDPIDARSRYENIAPATLDAFFRNPERIDQCSSKRAMVATVEEFLTTRSIRQTGQKQQFIALKLSDIVGDKSRSYFLHGDPGISDASFALSLMHIENNRALVRGVDSDPEDDYDGDVVAFGSGDSRVPQSGCTVIYFDERAKEVARTQTNTDGKHSLWLPPGVYNYSVFVDAQKLRSETGIIVECGTTIEVETGSLDAAGEPIIKEVTVHPIVEDLILEWRPQPENRIEVDYENVLDVLKQLCAAFNIVKVTFDKMQSQTLVQSLQTVGVYAENENWTNTLQMAMFKSLRHLVNEGLIDLLFGEEEEPAGRAAYQMRRLRNLNNIKICPPDGEWKDLADARAGAAYLAVTLGAAGQIAAGAVNVWNPMNDPTMGGNDPSAPPIAQFPAIGGGGGFFGQGGFGNGWGNG